MTAHSLSSRLVRWEEARRQGVELSPEDLCPDAPELAERLRDGIAWLRRLDADGCAESGTMSRLAPLAGSFYGTIATPLPATEGAAVPAVPGFEIEGEIGRGGMGVVYKARQVSLNRPVALKMILSGAYASESELARFKREAEALARLRHPNIVTIHDIGEHEGRPYFSLELCEGGSLEGRLAEGPLPPREAAALVEVLARAVDAAHRASLVHRDLKPSNVLLGVDGTAKVTDFGLAKKLDEVGQTQTGDVMGTPSYMAPEQARGQKDVGAAADVYALGAILYECLTGRPPFKAATAYDTIVQVITEEPVAPTALNAKVPRDLETIALKCLQKSPAGRYASAAELADDLRRWLGGEAIMARPVGVVERARKWVRRRPAVSGLLALVAALVAGGVVTITALYGDAVRQAGIAAKERDAAREAEGRAEAARARAEERTAMSRYAFQLAEVRRELDADNVERAAWVYEQCPAELRGWEHAHLGMRIAERARALPNGTVDQTIFESVAFSPDGRRLAGGSHVRGSVHIWDVETGKQVRALRMRHDRVNSVRFSPKGRWLAAAAGPGNMFRQGLGEGEIVLFDAETGARQCELVGHRGAVLNVRFGPDGSWLVSTGADGKLNVWEVPSGRLLRSFDAKGLRSLDVHPDGSLVACGSHKEVVLRDTETWRVVRTLPGVQSEINSVAFSGDGQFVAGADALPGRVLVWETQSGKLVRSFSGAEGHDQATVVAFAPGKRALLCFAIGPDMGWRYRAYDLQKEDQEWAELSAYAPCEGVAFSPDGARVALVDRNEVLVRHTGRNRIITRLRAERGAAAMPAFLTPAEAVGSGSIVLPLGDVQVRSQKTTGTQLAVKVVDSLSDLVLAAIICPSPEADAAVLSPDGTVRAEETVQGIAVRDGRSNDLLCLLPAAEGASHRIAFSPDGRRLLCAATRGMKLYDVRTGVELAQAKLAKSSIRDLGFDAATGAVVLSDANAVEIWLPRPAGGEATPRWALCQLVHAGNEGRMADWEALSKHLAPGDTANRGIKLQRARGLYHVRSWVGLVGALKELTELGSPAGRLSEASELTFEPLEWWLTEDVAWYLTSKKEVKDGGVTTQYSVDPPLSLRKSLLDPLESALRASPDSWALRALRGWMLLESGRAGWDQAAKELTTAARGAGKRADLWALVVEAELRRGDQRAAEAAYREVTRLAPAAVLAWHERGVGSHFATARLWHYDKLLAHPGRKKPEAELRAGRGKALLAVQRWREARDDLELAAKARPASVDLRCDLAEARLGAGDLAGYRRSCAEVTRRWSAERGMANRIVRTCVRAPDAVPDLNRLVRLAEWGAAELGASEEPAQPSVLIGAALLRAGRTQEAVRYLSGHKRVWEGDADRPLLPLAHRRLGQEEEALRIERLGRVTPEEAASAVGQRGPLTLLAHLALNKAANPKATRLSWENWLGLPLSMSHRFVMDVVNEEGGPRGHRPPR